MLFRQLASELVAPVVQFEVVFVVRFDLEATSAELAVITVLAWKGKQTSQVWNQTPVFSIASVKVMSSRDNIRSGWWGPRGRRVSG